MKSTLVILTLALAAYVSAESIPGLGYVTQFGNKHYWEHTQPVTQERGSEFCHRIGFELAKIDSEAELVHLAAELGSYDYWTSGISKGGVETFVWDLAWNEQNPVEIPVEDIRPVSGIYLQRNSRALRTTELSVSMRPLCQHVVYPEGCSA